ncbi:cell wall hydrolase [Bacillaceae bacterium]
MKKTILGLMGLAVGVVLLLFFVGGTFPRVPAFEQAPAGNGRSPVSASPDKLTPDDKGREEPKGIIHIVRAGDTLWGISRRYRVDLQELMKANGLKRDLILTGQMLRVPLPPAKSGNGPTIHKDEKVEKDGLRAYRVKPGDTLWEIARTYSVDLQALRKTNGIAGDLILAGQLIHIPEAHTSSTYNGHNGGKKSVDIHSVTHSPRSEAKLAARSRVERQTAKKDGDAVIRYTEDDLLWLAKIIEAEAENQPYRGKVAVGSVVINRIKHGSFPDTIKKVIFEKSKGGVYQFQPVANGRIYRVKPSAESYEAAKAALSGADPTGGALFFYNPRIATSKWIRTRQVVAVIGEHHFAE